MRNLTLITSKELACQLRVAHKTVLKWAREGLIIPEFTMPSGEHRFNFERTVRQLKARR
jgi:predicted site-specific integrase-resolvase